MAVKLHLVKYPPDVAPAQLSTQFGAEGGVIGRGMDTDWVLADPRRFLSSNHCRIAREADRYLLTDLSTNGTYLNGASSPLGRGAQAALADGDVIDMGDYQIKVSIVAQDCGYPQLPFEDAKPAPQPSAAFDSFSADDPFSTPFADVMPGSLSTADPLLALGQPFDGNRTDAREETPAQFATDSLLDADPLSESFDWPVARAPASGLPDDWGDDISILGQKPGPAAPYALDEDDALIARQPAVVAPEPELIPPPSPRTHAGAASVNPDLLLQALGLDEAAFNAREVADLQLAVGEMVRESLAGMMQVLRSRASIKNEFRMSITTIQPIENNPIKFSASVDDALQTMFVRKSPAYKPPVDAVKDSFDAIADHQIAVIAGIRSAFRALLTRFDPALLEENFKQAGKDSVLRGIGKGKYWSAYEDHYQSVVDNMERSFQELFGDDFVQAYEDQLGKLARARRQNKNGQGKV